MRDPGFDANCSTEEQSERDCYYRLHGRYSPPLYHLFYCEGEGQRLRYVSLEWLQELLDQPRAIPLTLKIVNHQDQEYVWISVSRNGDGHVEIREWKIC